MLVSSLSSLSSSPSPPSSVLGLARWFVPFVHQLQLGHQLKQKVRRGRGWGG